MCLILSYNPEARVANTDIICYKLVVKKANGIYNSLYRKFEYIKGETIKFQKQRNVY